VSEKRKGKIQNQLENQPRTSTVCPTHPSRTDLAVKMLTSVSDDIGGVGSTDLKETAPKQRN
jgi:hypothetical protein